MLLLFFTQLQNPGAVTDGLPAMEDRPKENGSQRYFLKCPLPPPPHSPSSHTNKCIPFNHYFQRFTITGKLGSDLLYCMSVFPSISGSSLMMTLPPGGNQWEKRSLFSLTRDQNQGRDLLSESGGGGGANHRKWKSGGGGNRFYNSLCVISLIRRTLNVKKVRGKCPLFPPVIPPLIRTTAGDLIAGHVHKPEIN